MPIVRLGVPVRANLRVEGSTGIASVTDAARQGWDRASPLPEPFPAVSGHGVPVHPLSRVSFFRASGKRDAASASAAALARRGFQTSPARGNREKPRPGLPKAVPDAAGTSAKARCRSLPPPMRPARTNPPQAAIEEYFTWRIQRTGERFRKPLSTTSSE